MRTCNSHYLLFAHFLHPIQTSAPDMVIEIAAVPYLGDTSPLDKFARFHFHGTYKDQVLKIWEGECSYIADKKTTVNYFKQTCEKNLWKVVEGKQTVNSH